MNATAASNGTALLNVHAKTNSVAKIEELLRFDPILLEATDKVFVEVTNCRRAVEAAPIPINFKVASGA